jgi:hypothetical protein
LRGCISGPSGTTEMAKAPKDAYHPLVLSVSFLRNVKFQKKLKMFLYEKSFLTEFFSSLRLFFEFFEQANKRRQWKTYQ